jgi:hypothetical protein
MNGSNLTPGALNGSLSAGTSLLTPYLLDSARAAAAALTDPRYSGNGKSFGENYGDALRDIDKLRAGDKANNDALNRSSGDALQNLANGAGDLAGKLGRLLGLHPNGETKGKRTQGIPPSDKRSPFNGTPGVNYNVLVTYGDNRFGETPAASGTYTAPITIQRADGAQGVRVYSLVTGSGTFPFLDIGSGNVTSEPKIASMNRVDGQKDPKQAPTPTATRPNGEPAPTGLSMPDSSNSPTAQPTNPTATPSNAPSVTPGKNPSEGKPTPESPSTPQVPFIPVPVPINPLSPTNGQQQQSSPNVQAPSLNPLSPSSTTTTTPKTPTYPQTPGNAETPTTQPQPKPATPNATPGDGDKCCPQTTADLEEIKKVLGVGEYGVSLPLLTGDNPQLIKNIPDLLMWTNRNIDATQGLYPLKVKVKQPNGSEKTITLNDGAHAMQELFAMSLTIAEDADAAVNIGARIATEVIHTKVGVFQGNELLKAIQKFFGFDTRAEPRVVKLNFTPSAAGVNNQLENDEIAAFLKPSTQPYVGTEFNDKQTALPLLQRILHNSEIAMRAVWQPIKPDKKGRDDITGSRLKAANQKPTKTEEEIWKNLQETLKILGYEGVDVTGKLKGDNDKSGT